ncbi:MAG: YdbH domain-containing protein [Pseudomonadota bacterium]
MHRISMVMRILFIAVAVLVGLILATAAALPWLAEPALRLGLRLAAINNVNFADLRFAWGEIEVDGLVLDPDQRLDKLRIIYQPQQLLDGRVEHVEIDGLAVHARWHEGQLGIPGLPAGDESSGGNLLVPEIGQVMVRDAQLVLDTDFGVLEAPLTAEVRTVDQQFIFDAAIENGRFTGADGAIRADLDLEGHLPADSTLDITQVAASGSVTLTADGVGIGLAEGIDGAARLAIALDGGRLRVETSELAATVARARLDDPNVAAALPLPWHVQLGEEQPLLIDAEIGTDDVSVDGALALATAGPHAELDFELAAVFAGAEISVGPSRARIVVNDAAWRGARLAEARIDVRGEGDKQRNEGVIGIEISGAALENADLTVAGVALRQQFDWFHEQNSLRLQLGAAGTLEIDEIATPDLLIAPLRIGTKPGDQPLILLDLNDGAIGSWSQHLTAAIEILQAQVGAESLALQSDRGDIEVNLEGSGSDLQGGKIDLRASTLKLPAHQLALDGIAATVGLSGDGLAMGEAVPLSIERISHEGRPAWFAPMAFRGSAQPDADGLDFEGELDRIGGGLTLKAFGRRGTDGEGRASIELDPIVFSPGLQPKDLAPIVGNLAREVTGQLRVEGDLAWPPQGSPTSDLAVLVEELSFVSGPVRLGQINGLVQLDRPWPLTSRPQQQVSIGLLDLGVPLTAGLTTFQLLPGPRVDVTQLEWTLAGGTARAEPFSLGSPLDGSSVTLRAEQLDLGQLLDLTRLDGLTGEGSLDGVLPIELAEGAAVVTDGKLQATEPGVLRYASSAAPAALRAGGEGVDLLLQALENFRYEELEITLEGRTDATMDIGLHLAGANPDLYDAHPIEFNLDLEGALANILRQGVASYQIPDRIRERMQGFGR